jgi:hypothetical protein
LASDDAAGDDLTREPDDGYLKIEHRRETTETPGGSVAVETWMIESRRVETGVIETLLQTLEDKGFEDDDIRALEEAIGEDEAEGHRPGPRLTDWFFRKSVEFASLTGVTFTAEQLAHVLGRYFGWL